MLLLFATFLFSHRQSSNQPISPVLLPRDWLGSLGAAKRKSILSRLWTLLPVSTVCSHQNHVHHLLPQNTTTKSIHQVSQTHVQPPISLIHFITKTCFDALSSQCLSIIIIPLAINVIFIFVNIASGCKSAFSHPLSPLSIFQQDCGRSGFFQKSCLSVTRTIKWSSHWYSLIY